jgi:DedD protein
MSKNDKPNDGFLPKVLVGSIVVIWVSLVGGSWLGRYAVDKGYLGKNEASEFKPMASQRPKPWITVDPKQAEEVDGTETPEAAETNPSAALDESDSPTPEEVETSTPVVDTTPDVVKKLPPENRPPAGDATESPEDQTTPPAPTPNAALTADPDSQSTPAPTPALPGGGGGFQLQFGSFGTKENAQKLVDDLGKLNQPASVEEVDVDGRKSYRVRGGSYSEDQAREQRDKLIEQNIKAYIVNTD